MDQSESAHVWDLIKDIHAALLITHQDSAIDARPMSATARPDDGAIYILANKGEDSDRQVQQNSDVVLSFQDGNSFVVVHGRAQASDDKAKIKEIWTVFAKAWWDGPEDPRIRLIKVVPGRAEYWESPGKVISYSDMLISAATGKRPSAGEHGQVTL